MYELLKSISTSKNEFVNGNQKLKKQSAPGFYSGVPQDPD